MLRNANQTKSAVGAEPTPVTVGAYRIYERIGSGGQACVYRARRLGDPDACDVALKRLHPHLTGDEDAVQSFAREARAAYLLDHPAIRRVFSLCREPDELFMIMEYVDGLSLHELLRRAQQARRRAPLPGVLALMQQLCAALHYAHELVDETEAPAGLVHRDVSPTNLLLTTSGRFKLIDMGIARSADHATDSGRVKGKYGYMAPEVMRNAPFDRRADVFSAGVVAWELLTLRKLFPSGNSPLERERARARRIVPPSSVTPSCPAALDAVVLRALADDPADRWPTCAHMAEALQEIARPLAGPVAARAIAELVELFTRPDDPSSATPETVHVGLKLPPLQRWSRRCRRSLALGAVGGSLATALTAALVISAQPASTPGAAGSRRAAVQPQPPAGATREDARPDAQPPRDLLAVDVSQVARLLGPAPRSHSSSAAYRARLCIDTDGAVLSAAVLEGPWRLHRRIERALLGWRYLPYRDDDGLHPVCFDVASHVRKISGCS